LLKTDNSGVN